MRRDQQPYELPVTWIPVTNQESEPVPPYGVVEIKSIDESTGIAVVGKPSSDNRQTVFFNGPSPIQPSGAGQVTSTFPATAAYQADDGTGADPAHDEIWGVVAESWYLHKRATGFRVIGAGGNGSCNVTIDDYGGGGFWSRIGCRTEVSGTWEYAHTEVEWDSATQSPPDDKTGGRVGYTRQSALVERTTTGDATTTEVELITFCGETPTSGTYTISGSSSIAYNANAATVQTAVRSALGGTLVTVSGTFEDGFTVTWPSNGAQTLLTVDVSGLSPAGPTTPAYEVNNQKVKSGTVVWMEWDAANSCYRFAVPFMACGGVDLPGFVAGRKNWVYVDSDGCWKVVPGNTDC